MTNLSISELVIQGAKYSKIQDYETSLKYYLEAVKKGDIESMVTVGLFYQYGDGVDVDLKEAFNGMFNCLKTLTIF